MPSNKSSAAVALIACAFQFGIECAYAGPPTTQSTHNRSAASEKTAPADAATPPARTKGGTISDAGAHKHDNGTKVVQNEDGDKAVIDKDGNVLDLTTPDEDEADESESTAE